MDRNIFNDDVINVLKRHSADHRNRQKRPILVFSCGGDAKDHVSRDRLRRYVQANDTVLDNVYFMSAENIAKESAMYEFDLLAQEAIIADMADWLVLFAESVGSYCELGAFAALPHTVSIMSVVVDKRYKNSTGFLLNGPVKVVENCKAPLSDVFYSDLECPMENAEFESTVLNIRDLVEKNEKFPTNKGRKTINHSPDTITVGSFAHELLDLIVLFQPISEEDLLTLYSEVKGFEKAKLKLFSRVLSFDMKKEYVISIGQVLAAMRATELIGVVDNHALKQPHYYSKVRLNDYFMFRRTQEDDFRLMRAKVLLSRKGRRQEGAKSLYRRFDPS